jgi:hypothetical protein
MLPNNMLREIYARADPRTQARMRAASSAVHELPAPRDVGLQKAVRRALIRAGMLQDVMERRWIGWPLAQIPDLQRYELSKVKGRSDKEVRAAVNRVNDVLNKLERELSPTNAERSRSAAAMRKYYKTRRVQRYESKTSMRGQRRMQRRQSSAASAVAAATATTLVPGRGAPFAVLRGGQRRSLANAVDASARHPAVSGR